MTLLLDDVFHFKLIFTFSLSLSCLPVSLYLFCLLPSLSLCLFSLAVAAQTATAPSASASLTVSLCLCLPVSLSPTLLPPACPLPPSPPPSLVSPLSVLTCSRGSGDEAPKCLLPDGLVVRAVRAGLSVLVHRLQQL